MKKKLLIGIGAVAAVLVIVIGLFLSNLDSIVKAAIEKYGSEAAQTKVEVGSVELSPTTGQGKLTGLRVANPEGFSSPDAFLLGMIDIQVDMQETDSNGVVVIQNIVIDKPQISFEVNDAGVANLKALTHNAQSRAQGEKQQAAANKESAKDSGGQETKLIVKELIISGARVEMIHSLFKDKKVAADIPAFTLRNLGEGRGGISPAELASQLLSAITQKASAAASKAFMQSLGFMSPEEGGGFNLNSLTNKLK